MLALIRAWTRLTPQSARALKGERARGSALRNTGMNHTVVTALTRDGMLPGLFMDGGVRRRTFEMYVQHCLAPALRPGQIVVMDNLRAHHSHRVREPIEARGAAVWYLPSYSPDLNPIEVAFSKVKGLIRRAEARTEATMRAVIWASLRAITPQDADG